MATLAEKKVETEAANPNERKLPLVLPQCVGRNRGGTHWAEWHVRFPEGGIADDLKESSIWRKTQDNPLTAMRRFDEVRILAFDASWVAYAIVAHATGNAVILGKPRIVQLPEARENLFQDETYAVRFVGHGYAVFRKRDGQEMAPAVHSAAAAQSVLINLYPRPV